MKSTKKKTKSMNEILKRKETWEGGGNSKEKSYKR